MKEKRYNKSENNKARPYNKVEKSRSFLLQRKEKGKADHTNNNGKSTHSKGEESTHSKTLKRTRSKKDDILKTLDSKGSRQISKTTSRSKKPTPGKNHNLIDFGSIVSNLVWMGVILFVFWDMPFGMKAVVVAFFGGQIVWKIIKTK